VRHFASELLDRPGAGLGYGGDPLADFTVVSFLDKMVRRNPKKEAATGVRGAGMEAGAGSGAGSLSSLGTEELVAAAYREAQGKSSKAVDAAVSGGRIRGASVAQPGMARRGASGAFLDEEEAFLRRYGGLAAEAASLAANGVDGSDGHGKDGPEDEDEEAFADRLAQGLLREAAGEDDEGEDDFDSGDDEALAAAMGLSGIPGGVSRAGEGEGDGDGEVGGFGGGEEDDEDEDGIEAALAAAMGRGEIDDFEAPRGKKGKSKKLVAKETKSRGSGPSDVFMDADDALREFGET